MVCSTFLRSSTIKLGKVTRVIILDGDAKGSPTLAMCGRSLRRGWPIQLAFAAYLAATSGCLQYCQKPSWNPPLPVCPVDSPTESVDVVEQSYARAVSLEAESDPSCVDLYYDVAARSWCLLRHPDPDIAERATGLYHSALASLIGQAAQHGRLDPTVGLTIIGAAGPRRVPIEYHGFVWGPQDFNGFLTVGDYSTERLTKAYREFGVGVPLLVFRQRPAARNFLRRTQPFPATVVLKPQRTGGSGFSSSFTLAFYDPLREARNGLGGAGPKVEGFPLTRDITAPFAYSSIIDRRMWLTNFLTPGQTEGSEGLFMLEPYQPGKIPLIFVHGLLSDPLTWVDMANEMRANPELLRHYQLWGFQYPTGQAFLLSAATLRQQLRQIRELYDPQRRDPAFSKIVLLGHSMGGLIAKLQVTSSGDTLWRATAQRPLATIQADRATLTRLANEFYFEPSRDITRVIFIGTPHRGSRLARECAGRIGSRLVRFPTEERAAHDQLIQDNPGVFSEEIERSFPTSIELLDPQSELLEATNCLPYRAGVSLHSIIGTGTPMWHSGPSDGVVPVSSARLSGVRSEFVIEAKHEQLHRREESIQEVFRILVEHLSESRCSP